MNIRADQLRAAANRAAALPKQILRPRALDYIPERKRPTDQRRLAARNSFLGEGGARPSPTELERIMGSNDLVDEFYFDRALLAAMPVCRVIIRNSSGHVRGYATGFMISPRLSPPVPNWVSPARAKPEKKHMPCWQSPSNCGWKPPLPRKSNAG